MCRTNTHLKSLIGFFILLFQLNVFSQEGNIINPPIIEFSSACANNSFNNFEFLFSISGGAFDADNDFIVELSDANGDFTNAINVNTLLEERYNTAFSSITANFILPEDAFGDGYRIRIKSTTLPEISSEPSEPFEAYFEPDFNIQLISENSRGESVTAICSGDPLTLSVSGLENALGAIETDNINDYQYAWYKDFNIIDGENNATLNVEEPGFYYASFYLGETCTLNAGISTSFFITESEEDVGNLFIEGNNTIELCADETYDLVASIDDNSYTYNWYKDDVLIDSGYIPVLTTPEVDQYGVYHLELDTNTGCIGTSQDVTVQPREGSGFTITVDSELRRVILPGETIVLNVMVEPNNPPLDFVLFRNDVIVTSGTTTENSPEMVFNIIQSGEYYVQITDDSSDCAVSLSSEVYTILEPEALIPVIRTSEDYEECNSISTMLSIVGVNALATDGETYGLSVEQLALSSFSYQWLKDEMVISGATSDSFEVTSYVDNGIYQLYASVGGGSSLVEGRSDSDEGDIKLSPGLEIASSSISNKICPGSTINLSIDVIDGFTYTWFKDDEEIIVDDISNIEIDDIGVYYVGYEGFDCLNETERVEIEIFDEEVLVVDPSTTAVLVLGETVTLTASGANSYQWFNEAGTLLSSNETLEVSNFGLYRVVGTVEDCDISKEIEVVEDDGSFTIPNILTPFNLDGVNDTWQIPNKFAFQSNIQILMYNSRGDEIYNTFDYQNDWPQDLSGFRAGMLFYFKVISEDSLIKAGTISVLE